jgi:uncharacterized membrane protein
MTTFLVILAVIVVVLCIRAYNNKTLDAIHDLEIDLARLQEQINGLTAPKVQERKATKEAFIIPAPTVAPVVQAVEEKTEKAPKEWNRYMPSSQKQTTEIRQPEPISTELLEDETPEPPKRKKDLEKFIGENLLSKIGIATLVLGIGYFVKYAIDKNWINEIGRVAIGILLGGSIIAVAHKLRSNYRTFSSILVGGGISVLYITISIAFHDYHLFSQTVSFGFLILITILSVFLAILYDRKELAIFSLLGGFASPLMVSSETGNYIVLFSYILILNTGMLILAFKKQWRIVSLLAYILTQLFYWSWLASSFRNEYAGATCFILLFYVQFYVLALIDHFKSNRQITGFQAFIILSNNVSLFSAGLFIFKDISPDIKGIITMAVAVLNAIPMVVLFKAKAIDKRLLYLLIAIVLTFVSLAVPIQLNGCAITMFWAAEAVILLWLWQKSGIQVFKYGFLAVEPLVLISLLMDWQNFYYGEAATALPILFNRPFITGVFITITVFINSRLLNKEKDFLSGVGFNAAMVLKFIGVILVFFILFFELRYQMERFYKPEIFCLMIYGLYCYLFAGVLTIVRKNKTYMQKPLCIGLIISIIGYVLVYNSLVLGVRGYVLSGNILGGRWGYFAMHYPALLSIVVFFVYLLKQKSVIIGSKNWRPFIYWLVCIASLFILSFESDNILLMLFHNGANKSDLLKISHNIIYPVLWGVSAFVLMIIGMKNKNRVLRIISLSVFSLIIVKLYLIDIWRMEQTGRIIAFIILGIIFLVVSFLYQKLKVLLKKEEENPEIKEREE